MKRVYLTIFLISCAALIFQISLIRLFSIYLSYHFAFMVISIAMLGIGSAGTVLSLSSHGKRSSPEHDRKVFSKLTVYALCAGVSILLGYIASNRIPFDPARLSWDRLQVLYIALYCFVLSIPFFFSGMLIATAFTMLSENAGRIYGADLLGAGTGSLAVIGLLHIAGPEYAVVTASTLCFIASLVMVQYTVKPGSTKLGLLAISFIALNLMIGIFHPELIHVRISPYKGLSLALKYPGAEHLHTYYSPFSRIDTLKSPAVRLAPGLSLKYLDPLPEQTGFSIDGGELSAVTKADDRNALTFLEFLPSALAYEIFKSPLPSPGSSRFDFSQSSGRRINVLVIEPKGGLQALMGYYYGAETVHKVESNSLLVNVIRDELGVNYGGIFKHDTWTGLARSWLHGSKRKAGSAQLYDIIDIPMTGASVSRAFGIAEDYRFTVEAFQDYLASLKKDGFINISLYRIPPPRTELRILATLITALEKRGIKNVSGHIAAIRSWDSITILAKNTPLHQREINHIREFAGDKRFDLIHYPGIKEEETNLYVRTPTNEDFKAFKDLLDTKTRPLFLDNYLFNIKPVYDENPFFHYYLKLKNIKAIYQVMGQKWQYFIEEGYLLPVIFITVLILSAVMILLPAIVKYKVEAKAEVEVKKKNNNNLSLLSYFAMLGLGFLFVEVTLIQKSILSLENPSYAVATVLTAILISSGTGSLVSSRIPGLRSPFLLLVLCLLITIYSLILPFILNLISPYSLSFKILLVFLILIPPGFFMGIPFPLGIRLLGQKNKALIPWAWAINGCSSVLAPILTILIAMTFGFRTVLWLGALAYLLAFLSLRKLMKA